MAMRMLLTVPMVNTEVALTRIDVQKGTGVPSISAWNSGPARATKLSTWNFNVGPAHKSSGYFNCSPPQLFTQQAHQA